MKNYKDHLSFPEYYWNYLYDMPDQIFSDTLEKLYLGIIVWDASGRVLFANPAVRRCYQTEPAWMSAYFEDKPARTEQLPFSPEIREPLVFAPSADMTPSVQVRILRPVFSDDDKTQLKFVIELFQEKLPYLDVDGSKENLYADKDSAMQDIVGRSLSFLRPLIELKKIADSNMPVLLLGESGVGKTLIAQYVHECSPRKEQRFFSVNCGAIPGNLLEAELFGYAPGAFTDASKAGRKGIFEIADRGTVFLDEIGDMPLPLQVKILHVIENKRLVPVGGREAIRVDVRIITATNKNLKEMIRENLFRSDLYWRISTFYQTIPPLRERKEDIIPLAHFYLNQLNERYDTHKIFDFTTLYTLMDYEWPGNVRELRHVVERMYFLSRKSIIYFPDFEMVQKVEAEEEKAPEYDFEFILDAIKGHLVQKSYAENKTSHRVAEDLNISPSKAYRLIKKYCES
ncbi:sigma 54-interacting transcriptional regulator [Eubacterium sp. 1001713B170207_170306_E7]|uniref:sigma-54 interaction domain-containing protein n=1 Tax=Eubacterium sp. 1001713B170207_170306_E7 TaxID=2787097 RepID=UPI00189BB8CD|nr:sigma 54-interacting transcriptional regulator [Eubacterium sp. 1001713B170207_170306_E7]